jgi:hypothetical protein
MRVAVVWVVFVVLVFVVGCRFELPEGTSAMCPAIFEPMTGGTPGHVYFRATTDEPWETLENACQALSPYSHLAVPDNVTELASLKALVDSHEGPWPMFWVGIHDRGAEGTFVEVETGGVWMPSVPWASGQPDNDGGGDGEDCVAATATAISDEGCSPKELPAICECGL